MGDGPRNRAKRRSPAAVPIDREQRRATSLQGAATRIASVPARLSPSGGRRPSGDAHPCQSTEEHSTSTLVGWLADGTRKPPRPQQIVSTSAQRRRAETETREEPLSREGHLEICLGPRKDLVCGAAGSPRAPPRPHAAAPPAWESTAQASSRPHATRSGAHVASPRRSLTSPATAALPRPVDVRGPDRAAGRPCLRHATAVRLLRC